MDSGLGSACGAGGHAEVEAGISSRDGWDEQCGDVCALRPGLPRMRRVSCTRGSWTTAHQGDRQGIKGRGRCRANIRAQWGMKEDKRQAARRMPGAPC